MTNPLHTFLGRTSPLGKVHAASHPSRIGAIARLYGVESHAPKGARILELGCAKGHNLLAIAHDWPEAECTGVDLNEEEIMRAREDARDMEFHNVRFHCTDIRQFKPEDEYDYILCHNVFSWVADDVKEAIFRLCAKALATNGIAFITYNTYPGWMHREALREFFLSGTPASPGQQLKEASDVLRFFAAALEPRTDPYGVFFRDEVAHCQKKNILSHDQLGPVNDPCYFLQFVERAQKQGLTWVSDSPPSEALTPEELPEPACELLTALSLDRHRYEQMCDLLVNRAYRASILCRNGRMKPPGRRHLQGVVFRTTLHPEEENVDVKSNAPVEFISGTQRITVCDPVIKAVLYALQIGVQPFEALQNPAIISEGYSERLIATFLRDLLVRGVAEAVLAG